ncbi:MAG: DUF5119 domain-containing protein [Rikenellaceae bacterium]
MRPIIRYIVALFAITTTFACVRQELEDPYQYLAHIPIGIDWSESLLDMDQVGNVSIYFYPKDGSARIEKLSDDLYYNLVELPIGEYSVLIFNDLINNVSGVSFNNASTCDQFSVNLMQTDPSTPTFYDLATGEVLAGAHSRMASWYLDEFIVDDSMVEYTRSTDFDEYIATVRSKSSKSNQSDSKGDEGDDEAQGGESSKSDESDSKSDDETKSTSKAIEEISNVVPQPVTSIVNVTVRVENLNNTQTFETLLRGTANGSLLAANTNIAVEGQTHLYHTIVANRSYDDPDNGIDGTVTFSHNTFGREPTDESYSITFEILLQSGKLCEFERDVTDQVVSQDGKIIEIDLTGDDELITLPEYSEAGFNVGDWDNDVQVYL